MKKSIVILTLMVITCIPELKAQTYISGFMSYIGDDGEWTDWIEENVEITIDKKSNLISIFDPLWLTHTEYKITAAGKPEQDEDKDIATVYQCKDGKGGVWKVTVIDLVTTDPGKLQINISNDTKSTSYHVMEAEEE